MIEKGALNTYAIRLTGKAFIPKSLEIGYNYKTELEGSITSLTEEDNNDGTHTFYYNHPNLSRFRLFPRKHL